MGAPAGRCQAADWIGFLGGPERTARVDEKELMQTWPANGPPLLWQTDGLGRSFGEVLVVGESVFAAGSTGRNTGVLQCLDVATGKQRWKVPALAEGDSTPAWDAGRIFLQSGARVSCHDAKDGQLLWQADPKKLLADAGVAAAKIPTPGYSGPWVQSLLAHEGLVVVVLGQPQGLVLALDGATGKTRWVSKGEKQAIGQSWSSASLVRCGKREIIVAPTTGDLVAVDPLSGKVLWEERVYPPDKAANGGLYTWACPPAYGDGLLFAYAGYRRGGAFNLDGDGTSIDRAWDTIRIHPHQENVIAVNGLLFGTGGIFPSDLDANPSFLLNGKPVNDLPSGTVQKLRAQPQRNPDKPRELRLEEVSPGRTLLCQDLKTGKVLGARGVGAVQGFSNHLLTYADPLLSKIIAA
jgi:hypothetical protein